MSPKQATKQKPVSTPVLILGGLALIGLAVIYLQPSPAPTPMKSNQKITKPVTPVNPTTGSQEGVTTSTDGATDPALASDTNIDGVRDPFLPSVLVAKYKPVTPVSKPVPKETPTVIQPVTTQIDKVEPVQPVKKETSITWRGNLAVKNDQIVIIKVENKSYSLRLGDKVPGTDYLVAEISPTAVLLISPKDQKRLTRKKEEK